MAGKAFRDCTVPRGFRNEKGPKFTQLDRQVFTNETATFIEAYCALVFSGAFGVGNSLLWTNHPKGDASEGLPSVFINNTMLRFNASLHYTHHNICPLAPGASFPGMYPILIVGSGTPAISKKFSVLNICCHFLFLNESTKGNKRK